MLNIKDALDDKYCPKETYRPGQKAAVISLFGALCNGYKYVALNAPTGSGKSIIAAALGNIIGESYILTTEKKLQDQYLDLGDDYTLVKGRGNFPCTESPGLTADRGKCLIGQSDFKCQYKPKKAEDGWKWGGIKCKYWEQIEDGIYSKHTIFNYSYYVLKMNSMVPDFPQRQLQIYDEGHNLESHIRKIATFEVHDRSLQLLEFINGIDTFHAEEFYKIPMDEIKTKEKAVEWLKELESVIAIRIRDTRAMLSAYDMSKQRLMRLEHLGQKLAQFLQVYQKQPNNWVISYLETGFKIIPLYIGNFTKRILFNHAEYHLIMSATLPNKKTLCHRLGIKESEMFYYDMASTFPPENAQIYSYAQPTMNWSDDMDKKRDMMARKMIKIMGQYDGRGLILCNSFAEVKHYTQYLHDNDYNQYFRLTVHSRGDKAEYIIDDHKSKKNSVMISPSMWEGVDLLGSLGEFLLIAKVPYADMKDPVVQGWMNINRVRYYEDAVQKIRQGSGRVVRSEDDKADIHILDGSFRRLFKNYMHDFPDEFKDRVKYI